MGIYIYNTQEIKKIEQACKITANILDDIEEIIEEGISTFDIDHEVRRLVKKAGVKAAFLGYGGFPGAICTSINEVVVHGIPDKEVKLKSGDIIGLDFGVCLDGFFGDSCRTLEVGQISPENKQLLEVTKESLYVGIEKAKVGNRISDISNAIEKHVKKHSFSPVKKFVGHGIGRKLHEEPSIPNYGKAGKGPRIKNGMVFAIEPMINIGTYDVDILSDHWTVVTKDKKNSAHFEHTIAIVDGKAEVLTKGKIFR